MRELATRNDSRDPLEGPWRGRMIVLAAGLTSLLVFSASAFSGAPPTVPGIALGSSALLHLERSLVVGAGIAGALIFLVRGWAGYFPSKLSTTGAEYEARPSRRAAENDDAVLDAVTEIRSEGVELAESMSNDIRALQLQVDALANEKKRVGRGPHIDDML